MSKLSPITYLVEASGEICFMGILERPNRSDLYVDSLRFGSNMFGFSIVRNFHCPIRGESLESPLLNNITQSVPLIQSGNGLFLLLYDVFYLIFVGLMNNLKSSIMILKTYIEIQKDSASHVSKLQSLAENFKKGMNCGR